MQSSSSESSNEEDVVYAESDNSLDWEVEEETRFAENDSFNVDDFIVVKFVKKKIIRHFIGQINEVMEDGEVSVKFLKKVNDSSYHFVFPEIDDVADVKKGDIVLKLPPPLDNAGTARVKAFFSFNIDLSHLL